MNASLRRARKVRAGTGFAAGGPFPSMRWRAALVLGASFLAVAGVVLLLPQPHATSAQPPAVVVTRAQPGDDVTVRVAAYDGTRLVYASDAPVTYTAGSRNGPLPGLADALVNASAGEQLNVTLAPADALGNYSWEQVVNVTRVHTLARDQDVSQRALERFTGQPATVGERVVLPTWPVVVTQLANGVATLHADVRVGDVVHRLEYWPSTVTNVTDADVTVRDDATVGTPVNVTGDDDSGGATQYGNVTAVNETAITVDFNPPGAGDALLVRATVVSVKPGASTLDFVAQLEAQQASCESHHAGFVAFQGTSDVTPNANGTAWVNVTVGDPWHHELTSGTVRVGNDSQTLPTLQPGQTVTLSFLEATGATLPVAVSGDAHFSHGGGIPDDSLYAASALANTAVRHQASAIDLRGATIDTGARSVTWGRWLGWLAFPLMLYPAWQGWRVRQDRLRGRMRSYSWPKWLDLHTMPAVAATLVGFGHGAVLMLDVYKGNTTLGVWTGVVALALLGAMGASGLVMARWVPARWKKARAWHASLTVVVLVLGMVHALLIGSTFKFLR